MVFDNNTRQHFERYIYLRCLLFCVQMILIENATWNKYIEVSNETDGPNEPPYPKRRSSKARALGCYALNDPLIAVYMTRQCRHAAQRAMPPIVCTQRGLGPVVLQR